VGDVLMQYLCGDYIEHRGRIAKVGPGEWGTQDAINKINREIEQEQTQYSVSEVEVRNIVIQVLVEYGLIPPPQTISDERQAELWQKIRNYVEGDNQ
jgi:hypothetical protein